MFKRFGQWLQNAMMGRYGSDQLNMAILVGALLLSVIGSIARVPWLTLLAWVPLILAAMRMLSRNTSKRYEENRKFLALWYKISTGWKRLWDKNYRYYHCPKCRQVVRVPKGKGKISITCPKCREKFIKKT